MINKLFIFTLLSILFCSCHDTDSNKENYAFPEIDTLQSHELNLEGLMYEPDDILLLDDYFLVKDAKSDFIFHFFDVNSYDYIGNFVRKGRGPGEEFMIQSMSHAEGNRFVYKTLNELVLAVFDGINEKVKILKQYDVPVDALIAAYPLNNEEVFGWNYQLHPKEFVLYNPSTAILSEYGSEFPGSSRTLSIEETHRLYGNKQFTVKPDKKLFATSYTTFPMIRIFNLSDASLVKEVHSATIDFPDARINRNASQEERKQITEHYFRIVSTDKYIYALHSGKTKAELYPDPSGPAFHTPDLGDEIHVLDWKGNLVKKICLDRKILSFGVSSDDKQLMAISVEAPDKVFIYDLEK